MKDKNIQRYINIVRKDLGLPLRKFEDDNGVKKRNKRKTNTKKKKSVRCYTCNSKTNTDIKSILQKPNKIVSEIYFCCFDCFEDINSNLQK